MKLNSCTQIIGHKVILVPYRKSHVKKYHSWMSSEELRKQTASEELSLEQEFEMQQSWAKLDDRCTFIVLDKETMERLGNENEAMIGDVNVYLTESYPDLIGEISLMIAEKNFQGKGLGKEVTLLMLRYAVEKIGVTCFQARISNENTRSLELFKKLNFEKESENKIFQETTLSLKISERIKNWLLESTPVYTEAKTSSNLTEGDNK